MYCRKGLHVEKIFGQCGKGCRISMQSLKQDKKLAWIKKSSPMSAGGEIGNLKFSPGINFYAY